MVYGFILALPGFSSGFAGGLIVNYELIWTIRFDDDE